MERHKKLLDPKKQQLTLYELCLLDLLRLDWLRGSNHLHL